MAQFRAALRPGQPRLRDARRFFSTRTHEQNYDFIDQVKHGLGRGNVGDPELEPIARMFSRMLDQRRPVTRDSRGRIVRSSADVKVFREDHQYPSTGSTTGPCAGYVIDHSRALKHGGDDYADNMQWQNIADAMVKDRTE
jgi:hypothetical protein